MFLLFRVQWASSNCGFMVFIKLGKYLANISSNIFSASLSSSVTSVTCETSNQCEHVPQPAGGFAHFWVFVSLCVSIAFFFKFTHLSHIMSNLLWIPYSVFSFDVVFFISSSSICLLKNYFIFFHHALVSLCILEHFCKIDKKHLSFLELFRWLIFLFAMGDIFLLLWKPGNFWSDVSHGEFYKAVCWTWLYSSQ